MIERDGPLSLSRQCKLPGVSRSSQYYRPTGECAENLALLRRLDQLHMAYPFYGSRQLMRHLRREGVTTGRHRIRQLMAVMGMEATYRRPRTSVASPEHRVFPYLLRGLTISRADHMWRADITYVPVTQGFFCLLAVMDWATRHVLAWQLSNTMDPSFCVKAAGGGRDVQEDHLNGQTEAHVPGSGGRRRVGAFRHDKPEEGMTLEWISVVAGAAVTGVIWYIRHIVESLSRERELLQDERRRIYMDALEPFLVVLNPGGSSRTKQKKATAIVHSPKYRATVTAFIMMGPDKAVHALNEMMQFLFSAQDVEPEDLIRLWGGLLLAIRKDLGNKATTLTPRDMLRATVTDIDSYDELPDGASE